MIKPGDNFPISREVLIDFISSSFEEANSKYKQNRYISRSFEVCGLNPFCNHDDLFQKNLDSLDENRLYDSITLNQEAVDCAKADVLFGQKFNHKK